MDRPEDRLALIELFERDSRAARAIDIHRWPLTIGRALDNQVVLADPHIAAHHARIEPDGQGRLTLTVLHSRNGVTLDGRPLGAGAAVSLPDGGATLHLGTTRLRLRLPGEVLAPETPLPALAPGHRAAPLLALAGVTLISLYGHWLGLDPGADTSAWLPVLVGLPVVVAGWCGLWALLSKLFQQRFDFGGHLRIALPWLLLIDVVGAVVPQAAAGLALPWLWQLSGPLQALLGALLVRHHLQHLLPLHPRGVTGSVAAVALMAAGISMALSYRGTDRPYGAPYMSTLPLPALRLAGTVPTATLVAEMAPLAADLARRVKAAQQDEADPDDAAAGD
ncbi:MAG: FHA domain-containing protein [Rubrivivax sp.]|nr:FHA domain-containing protein [Rubrivivax sp.]